MLPTLFEDLDPAFLHEAFFHDEDRMDVDPEQMEAIKATIDADPMGALLYSHPLYPNLVSNYFDLMAVGESKSEQERLGGLKNDALQRIRSDGDRPLVRQRVVTAATQDLDIFLERYINIVRQMKTEVEVALAFCREVITEFDAEFNELRGIRPTLDPILSAAADLPASVARKTTAGSGAGAGAGGGGGAGTNRKRASAIDIGDLVDMTAPTVGIDTAPEEMPKIIEARFKLCLTELQDEFRDKVEKPKLPDTAIEVMTNWWNANFAWPYPDDNAKAAIAEQANLRVEQVQNWFVNRRKRRWLNLFPGRKNPTDRADAHATLLRLGKITKDGHKI